MANPLAPASNSRTCVIGMNGSGKTTFALYLLSISRLDRCTVVLDYKRERFFETLRRKARGVTFVSPKWRPTPASRGIFIVQPRPQVDDRNIEALLWAIWALRSRPCLYADEAYLIPRNSPAFQAILTQGRSKGIQCIALIQRPVLVSRFVMSEANAYAIFFLVHGQDRKTVTEFVPLGRNYENPPAHHCYWYRSGAGNAINLVLPTPPADAIIDAIAAALPSPLW